MPLGAVSIQICVQDIMQALDSMQLFYYLRIRHCKDLASLGLCQHCHVRSFPERQLASHQIYPQGMRD